MTASQPPAHCGRILRYAGIAAGYDAAFFLADLFTLRFQVRPGITIWYPPAGISMALLVALGPRFAPALAVASLVSSFAVYGLSVHPAALVLWAGILAGAYAAAAAFVRSGDPSGAPLSTLPGATRFALAGIAVPWILAVLSTAGRALGGTIAWRDLPDAALKWILLDHALRHLRVDAADVLLLNPRSQMLEHASGKGFRSPGLERAWIRIGEGPAGRAALFSDLNRRNVELMLAQDTALETLARALDLREAGAEGHAQRVAFLRPALDVVYCHHERWDGAGYPRGLQGEEIPLPARIFAVANVYDALTSDRPWRAAWPEGQARGYMGDHAGSEFDPGVVQVFLEMVRAARS